MDYFCSMDYTEGKQQEAERLAEELSLTVKRLHSMGRYDLMLQAITVPLLEQLQIEAARTRLSRLVITADFRFILADYNKEKPSPPYTRPSTYYSLTTLKGLSSRTCPTTVTNCSRFTAK